MTAVPQPNTAAKWVYSFGDSLCEGSAEQRELLGGKGANLAEMSRLGLPVPPGFTLTTDVCTYFYHNEEAYPDGLTDAIEAGIARIEQETGKKYGDLTSPLLFSVRSGARVSMPGMMDTVLNIGLNDETVEGLAAVGNPRFAWDCYRRLIQMYGNVVMGIPGELFEDLLTKFKSRNDFAEDTDIDLDGLQRLVRKFKTLVREEADREFPQDPREQLWGAIAAVFKSWTLPRAVTYRTLNDIPHDWGTAVTVQTVVFGNTGDQSGTGVAFTRNPSTGENKLYGEYLLNAQGEDVVAGIRTPRPIDELADLLPKTYKELLDTRTKLEQHYRDMQDIEFTIQDGKFYVLQTRSGKRTAEASLRTAIEMVAEKLISKEEALLRVPASSLDQLMHPTIDPSAKKQTLAKGLPASPGAAVGEIVLDADRAEARAKAGHKVILCRRETSPEDIHGMHAAEGILTSRGGMTSHAAVVARGMGKPCIAGADAVRIDARKRTLTIGDTVYEEGDIITIDGGAGEVYEGAVPMREPELTGNFATLMEWSDNVRRLRVRTNADTPDTVQNARDLGAEGIGLCRTEHMFFDPERIIHMRRMILAHSEKERRAALNDMLPAQRQDFIDIFKIMEDLPVTIRLLDPPLHEFLPHAPTEIESLAEALNVNIDTIRARMTQIEESNPMLGFRGARLGVIYPEIYEMQVRAIVEAAQETNTVPEIMVPLICTKTEMQILRDLVDRTAKEFAPDVQYSVGTMIELPRAALRANEIAMLADFVSFGTNDLTQTTMGISRDDAALFLEGYRKERVFLSDPFATLDIDGTGELVKIAMERGRSSKPGLKSGICGEHGGDPASVEFFEKVGLDYVSCSPFRIPVARLAAAQATLKNRDS